MDVIQRRSLFLSFSCLVFHFATKKLLSFLCFAAVSLCSTLPFSSSVSPNSTKSIESFLMVQKSEPEISTVCDFIALFLFLSLLFLCLFSCFSFLAQSFLGLQRSGNGSRCCGLFSLVWVFDLLSSLVPFQQKYRFEVKQRCAFFFLVLLERFVCIIFLFVLFLHMSFRAPDYDVWSPLYACSFPLHASTIILMLCFQAGNWINIVESLWFSFFRICLSLLHSDFVCRFISRNIQAMTVLNASVHLLIVISHIKTNWQAMSYSVSPP